MSLIGQLLEKGIIDKQRAMALEYEAKNSDKREEEIILEKNLTSEDFLFSLKGDTLKIPFKTVSIDDISLKVLEIIPEESAKYYKIIPLSQDEGTLEVGMVYPDDPKAREALDFLARQSRFSYEISLITPSNFEEILKKYRSLKQEVSKALEELETELKEDKAQSRRPKTELERVVEEAPISKVVAVILRHAVDGNASDIHIEPTRDRVRVRFRLDGVLHSSLFLPLKILPAVVARIKIISNLKIDETRIPQDGRFSAKFEERSVDFRVSTLPTALGEKVVMRILDPNQRKVTFGDLGVIGRNLEVIERALKRPYGMILATGPTGSGKSTTLYAIMTLLNKEESNVVTLEDPVEYFIDGVNQSQVKPEIGYDFASGLRTLVRQDPDIIMVGEIRDEETASLAIHASLTGHIILSTLHTNNTIGAIPRLIDMGVRPFLIPPALSIIIAQRLVRKLCPYCRKQIKPKEEIKKAILKEIEDFPIAVKQSLKIPSPFQIYEPVGCKRCNNSGYAGRIGLFEILEMTDELSEIIYKDPVENKIKEETERQGMLTMRQDGVIKVVEGLTSFEEVLEVSEDK
jgi:type IV pilus assembly protein PilB